MMGVWASLLMMYGFSIAFSKNSAEFGLKGQPPLDLAPNAVDDMYAGCRDKMENRVKKQYLAKEKNKDKNFMLAWGEAEKYYNKKWKRKGKRPSTGLGKEQIMALYVYSLDKPNVYLEFNNAVRTNKSVYMTTFKYHALHFFLTDALQTLSARKPEVERCLTGYRRVNSYFSQDVLNKLIRFGSFTSSSMGWYPSSERFGDKSCFEIVTCSGVDISLYSKLGEAEREALIPPYEVFKVAKIERRSDLKSLPCEVVYKLKSARKPLSRLNCSLFKNHQPHMFSFLRVKGSTKQ
nr:PREDICTED: ecto-ADP-ribosyltransferase 5-like isoform X1 [Paralichthys olivaceus]